MCSDNVFIIIVRDFIKIAKKHFITSIYPKENKVNFQSRAYCKIEVIPLSTLSLDCKN